MESSHSIHHEVLENGLTLLLRESHSAPVVNLQIWVQVGSADERPGEEGLAHFHEHMLFKGTEERGVGDVAGEIEGAGGRINAYTSYDVTVYYATLPSDARQTGLAVLVDALRNSSFDPEEVERETEVVLEEIRRANDSPAHLLSDLVFETAYTTHPYRAPILGPATNVARFDKPTVEAFFRRWYTPDNMVVVAAGDFDAQELADDVRRAFGDATPGGATRSRPVEPTPRALKTVVMRRPFERARLDLSWPATSFRDADATHLDLLSFMLGECDSSRLVRRVKEQAGIVERIDSSCYTPLDPGLFSVNLECETARAAEGVAAAIAEVERLRREAVSPDELERARANFLATEHFERESVGGMASKLGHFHVLGGDWRSEERYFEQVRSATPEDLRRAAERYLAPEKLTAAALIPEADGELLDAAALEAAVGEGCARVQRAFAAPKHARQGPGARGSASPIETYELDSGAVVHVLPRHDVPVVAARAAFYGGLLAESDVSNGISSFLSSMWMRGTRARSAADLARAVEGLAAEIDGFSGRNSLGMTLESTADKLDATLDLFAEVLLEPGFDPEEVERERRDTLAAIDRRVDRLAQRAFLLFTETLYEHHPYRLPLTGSRASVERFAVDTLRAQHERLIRAPGLVMGISGDVDPDEVAHGLSVRLAALGRDGRGVTPPPPEAAPREPRRAHAQVDREQAHLVIGFQGLTLDDPDRHALELIAQVLTGQSGRLFLELRDRQSLAYSVNAVNVEGVAPGFFSVYIASAPEKVEQARAGILAEFERLVSEAPSEDELRRAKRYLIGNHAIDQQRNAARAGQLALDGLYGLGADAAERYPQQVSGVTGADVLRTAQRVLRLDATVEALIAP